MKFLIFLLLFSVPLSAHQMDFKPSIADNIYTDQELDLLKKMSDRHLVLLEKEEELRKKEEILNEKELILNQKLEKEKYSTEKKKIAQIYMQLPPSKAIILLEEKKSAEIAEILKDMPSNIASRLLDKMTKEKANEILELMQKEI